MNSLSGKHSPDLLIDDTKVDIKEVTTLSSIDHQLRKLYKQIEKAGIVLIAASQPILDKRYNS